MRKLIFILFAFLIYQFGRCKNEAKENNGNIYKITIPTISQDSTFELTISEPKENYLTVLWVSDPECTECKDCYVDSGTIKMPAVLNQYVKWPNDYYLAGRNPYTIENTYYVSYIIKGRVVGVTHGYPIFWVDSYKEQ